MRDHMFNVGIALLAATFVAAPLSVSAGETMNKAEEKIKGTAHDMKEATSDTWITSKTKIALFADGRVKGRDVTVETMNGEVFLRGKVESEEAKSAAAEVTRGIDGVKNVKNDLQVVSASTRPAVTTDDKVITRSVESRFSRDPELKKIDVRTDAGVVVLSGQVASITAAARASEAAHKVAGVKAVKNELRVNQAKAN
jgi:hyperosmotically inducible periplasmic protein